MDARLIGSANGQKKLCWVSVEDSLQMWRSSSVSKENWINLLIFSRQFTRACKSNQWNSKQSWVEWTMSHPPFIFNFFPLTRECSVRKSNNLVSLFLVYKMVSINCFKLITQLSRCKKSWRLCNLNSKKLQFKLKSWWRN
jgi:hypothetical protein